MQRAFPGKMGLEKFHLIAQHTATLQIDVLRMGWHKGNGQKLDARLLGGAARFMVVAPLASRHDIVPGILPPLAEGGNMISR